MYLYYKLYITYQPEYNEVDMPILAAVYRIREAPVPGPLQTPLHPSSF